MASQAIVTIAIGKKFFNSWTKVCEPNWKKYADLHGFDLICINAPLDDTERARKRSIAWQKCLILSQEFSNNYERIVWIDSDILINVRSAPDITYGVPIDKVGAVDEYRKPTLDIYEQFLTRGYEYWGKFAIVNRTAHEYYTVYGLPSGFDKVVQTSVMVLSPKHHRHLLEKTYYGYEEKGGREWHMEMRPLSYALLSAKAVHWIDWRFNLIWIEIIMVHYPFLLNYTTDLRNKNRIKRKLVAYLKSPFRFNLRRKCITNAFLNSYFLHIGGGEFFPDMELFDLSEESFLNLKF